MSAPLDQSPSTCRPTTRYGNLCATHDLSVLTVIDAESTTVVCEAVRDALLAAPHGLLDHGDRA